MARKECPKAIIIATKGICGHIVPLNQPSDSSVNRRLESVGAGGSATWPCMRSVIGHQISSKTTITVVICRIRSALELDSCIPLTLLRQK